MFGKLVAVLGGMLFYPFGLLKKFTQFAHYDHTLPDRSLSPDEEEWYMNDNARKFLICKYSHILSCLNTGPALNKICSKDAKSFTPRILFRGFTPDSGGGKNMLNGPHGVIPHGFLNGKKPTSMWNIRGLFDMICDHLDEDPDIISDFSSWTQMWSTALGFSGYPHDGEGMIAVLDTTSVEEHVWHTVDLIRADMAVDEYDDEYLIYGPITGPKYHCVSPRDLYRETRIRDLLQDTPFVFGEDPGSCAIERGAVQAATEVAAFLQPRGASVKNLAVLTARFVSYRADLITDPDQHQFMSYVDMDTYLHYMRDYIQFFVMHTDGKIRLVDETMFSDMRCLEFELQLLQAVQKAVRVKSDEVRATMWEICRLQSMDEIRPGDVMGQAENL
jgi:hypothetical protein